MTFSHMSRKELIEANREILRALRAMCNAQLNGVSDKQYHQSCCLAEDVFAKYGEGEKNGV